MTAALQTRLPELLTAAFYKFVELPDYAAIREPLLALCNAHAVKGTILLAKEGINGTIAGSPQAVREVLAWLRRDPRWTDLQHKESGAAVAPFYRMKVRLKAEIVTLGVPGLHPSRMAGQYVKPEDWNALLDDPELVLIDARNDYEVAIGSFAGAINPQTHSFSELPAWLEQHAALAAKPKVAMFCTGGIRCEKSTALLRARGFEQVYNLEGGILKYLETVPQEHSRWQGECFVFDQRVAVGHGLAPGHYSLCRACREPVSLEDERSPLFELGVSCPHCHARTTVAQKASAAERHRQVVLARQHKRAHIAARLEPAQRRADTAA